MSVTIFGQTSDLSACGQVTEAAWDLLSVMDEQAALANQKIDLFTSRERFPGVFEARENVAAADAALVRRLYLRSHERCLLQRAWCGRTREVRHSHLRLSSVMKRQ